MIRTTQWTNINRYRAYPIVEDSIRTFERDEYGDERIVLPLDFLLDMQVTYYSALDGTLFLANVHVLSNGMLVTLQHVPRAGGATEVIQVLVPSAATWPYHTTVYEAAYSVVMVFGRGVARIIDAYPVGVYLPVEPVALEPALGVYQGQHRVNSIAGYMDDEATDPLTGDIYWQEGHNVRIYLSPTSNTLSIMPSPGAGEGFSCRRGDPTRPTCSEILLMINGTPGDGTGNFQLVGGNGVRVEPLPDAHTLVIRTLTEPTDITCRSDMEDRSES